MSCTLLTLHLSVTHARLGCKLAGKGALLDVSMLCANHQQKAQAALVCITMHQTGLNGARKGSHEHNDPHL